MSEFSCPAGCGNGPWKTQRGAREHARKTHEYTDPELMAAGLLEPTAEYLVGMARADPIGAVLIEMIQASRDEAAEERGEIVKKVQEMFDEMGKQMQTTTVGTFDQLLEKYTWLQQPVQDLVTKAPGIIERAIAGDSYPPEVLSSVAATIEADRRRKERGYQLIEDALTRGNRLVEVSPERYKELEDSGVIEKEESEASGPLEG